MRHYLLDTTPLTAYFQSQPPVVALVQPWLRRREAATSILVYGEVLEYLKGLSYYPQRHAQLRRLLRAIIPTIVTHAVMEQYADLRRQLRPPYGPGLIGDIDTLIAATALTNNLTLVTTDRDFERVPDLQLLLLDRTTFQPVAR